MIRTLLTPLALVMVLPTLAADPAKESAKSPFEALASLPFRSIGPASASGRIGDIAVDPRNPGVWYVAVASGGVWKTVNAGASWQPIFDSQPVYAIGCVTVDPRHPDVVWVGSGENNSQRAIGYGDGVYRSADGGKTWENMGLKASAHIAKILVDPRNSDVVLVACQGPLWKEGGDRGLYRTTDGGKTWKAVLTADEHTGVTDVVMDPRDPNVLYAASYQRRRHVWGIVNGGPGSALWKSTDGGLTWNKLTSGLPKEDMGRIGLAVSPVTPGLVYAVVEAANKTGGFFASTDGGASWTKRSDYVSGSAQYYHELVPDPKNPDRVYAMDTWMQVTTDGGRTWKKAGERLKHVDNHALWIDPTNPDHLINGNDGGIYESWDRCATWIFRGNLPVSQFYRVAVDQAKPFYHVYGGTQDNNSLGGPHRSMKAHGVTNDDWFVTATGDGFWQACDPTDPNTVYSESQYGGLVRFDRTTGEAMDIKPTEAPGEAPLRWNWDAPVILSPHAPKRLYFAANRLFRSDDRGDSWKAVSPDLTRQLDRDTFKMMGKVWPVDAVARFNSTSIYGNIVSLSESPKQEGLLYVGTDDGLVQVSEDAGDVWRKVETFPGVPALTYVSCLSAGPHAAGTLYAAFNNSKNGDFKPYALRSRDKGRTWESIAGNLPAQGFVHVIKEDTVREGLLYCGTEFGFFFSLDAGKTWVKATGLPTIPVRDLAVQEREKDLVLATFGRGFYILDDLSPLREASSELLAKPAHLFGTRPSLTYIPSSPLGFGGRAFQGETYYAAENPPFGATFTYHIKEAPKSRKKARHEAEKETLKAGGTVKIPSFDALRQEDREEAPGLVLTIRDARGAVVNRVTGPVSSGLARLTWDLRLPSPAPVSLAPQGEKDPWDTYPVGPLASPGTYAATLAFKVDGVLKDVAGPVSFEVRPLFDKRPWGEREAFTQEGQALLVQVQASASQLSEALDQLKHVKKAILSWDRVDADGLKQAVALEHTLKDLDVEMNGDSTRATRNAPVPTPLRSRAEAAQALWNHTHLPTATQRKDIAWAKELHTSWKSRFAKALVQLKELERTLDAAGAPHTRGRGL